MDIATVRRSDHCDFGRWIAGEATASGEIQRRAATSRAHFHEQAAAMLRMIETGQVDAARVSLTSDDGVGGAISDLTGILVEWAAEAGV
jgi:hypothetical protein